MKHNKKSLVIIMVIIFTLLASSCKGKLPVESNKQQNEPVMTEIKLADGETKTIAENDKFSLKINSDILNVTLTDKKTGKEFNTNKDSNSIDSVVTGDNANLLKSQISLKYYSSKGNVSSMNSYLDSFKKKQYQIFTFENGLAIKYQFGDSTKGIESVPQKVNDTRFNRLFLDKLDDKEKELFKTYYRYFAEEKTWVITPRGRTNVAEIVNIMQKVGYSKEELIKDLDEYGLSTDLINKVSFNITIEFTLTDKGLSVSVPTKKMEMAEGFLINELSVLENFMTTTKTPEDSYIFVPDGSGALINTSNSLDNKNSVSLSVFGSDRTIKASKSVYNIFQVALPVFGIKDTKGGMLGIIEEGEGSAVINAYKAGKTNSNNAVYPTFKVMNMDYIYIAETTQLSGVPVFQNQIFDGEYRILYIPLAEGNDSYSAMASTYRDYLIENKLIRSSSKEGDIPLYVETINGVAGYKSFLNISYQGVKKTTSFNDCIDILNSLKQEGINKINLKLLGWFNNGVRHDYPSKIDVTGVLGGGGDLKKLNTFTKENNIGLFPDVDFSFAYDKNNGFSVNSDAARTLDFSTANIYDSSYVTSYKRPSNRLKENFKYIVSTSKYSETADKFFSSYKKYGIDGISLRSTSNELHSDYRKDKNIDRTMSLNNVVGLFEKVNQSTKNVMVNYGSSYSLKYVNNILDVPLSNSWFNFLTESVPFYQMVLHGSIDYAGTALNLSSDYKSDMLKAIEYGASPYYQVISEPSSRLNDTEIYTNFSANYKDLKANIVEVYNTINTALKDVQGKKITSHSKLSNNVYKTTYENGVSIYVNYSNTEFTVGDVTIQPNWYKSVKGV